MPYKSKKKKREVQRRWVRQKRKSVGSKMSNPVEPKVRFNPDVGKTPADISILPPERVEKIRAIILDRVKLGLPDDSKDRWGRAVRYREWELANPRAYR